MKIYIKKIINMFIGVILIGIGIGLCRIPKFGNDAYAAFNFSLFELTGIDYSIVNLIMNCILFIPMFILLKKKINIGSFVNMFLVGFVVDGTIIIFNLLDNETLSLAWRILLSIVGVVIESFGIAFYMKANIGIAPYDSLPIILEERIKIPFKYARIITDSVFMIIAFLISNIILKNNAVGIFTLVTMASIGPLVSLFRKVLDKEYIRGKNEIHN